MEERKRITTSQCMPISILVGITFTLFLNYTFDLYIIISEGNYLNLTILLSFFLILFVTKYAYIVSRAFKAYNFDNQLKKEYEDLFEVYEESMFVKYRNVKNKNSFIYFLREFEDIKDQEIEECIDYLKIKNKIIKILL